MKEDNETISNPSTAKHFREVVKRAFTRREFMRGSSAVVAAGTLASFWGVSVRSQSEESLIGFTPVPRDAARGDWFAVAEEYEAEILIPWGTPLNGSSVPFTRPTSSAQAQQVGAGHDGMWFFPEKPVEVDDDKAAVEEGQDEMEEGQEKEITRGVLCLNHEFVGNSSSIGKSTPESLEEVRVSQHAHGVSVLDFEKVEGKWLFSGGCHTRRIHVNTPVEFSGPAAESDLIIREDGTPPSGTLNNCGSGFTPWGTYLTCEENFQGYFGATASDWSTSTAQNRYGFSRNGFGYGWHLFDERFRLDGDFAKHEDLRFGWVVEIDPFDPSKPPVKRTGLGRFKHESCEVVVGKDNRIVAYMGDDQPNEYIYKFVGNEDYEEVLARGESPFDDGVLHVAKFNEDFTGTWLRLTSGNRTILREVGETDRIMIYTRLAASLRDPTPMDRPEWITAAPNGYIYCALTNNTSRNSPRPGNPGAANVYGHIIRWRDDDDPTSTTFTWNIFSEGRRSFNSDGAYSSPDTVVADEDGRLFICTDGGNQPFGVNNQVVVADTNTGELRRLFSGVPGCEVTGAATTPDRQTLFVNIQHPGGNFPGADFPQVDGEDVIPRDATIALRRKDGGIVGS